MTIKRRYSTELMKKGRVMKTTERQGKGNYEDLI